MIPDPGSVKSRIRLQRDSPDVTPLEEIKPAADQAEGLAVYMKDRKLDHKQTLRFELIDRRRLATISLPQK